MPVPERTNNEIIFDLLEAVLKSITKANGWHIDGMMVDANADPRIVRQNKMDEYRQFNTCVTMKLGHCARDPSRSIGQVHRQRQSVELMCLQTLTKDQDAAGLTVNDLKDHLRYDITWAINKEYVRDRFASIASGLGIADKYSIQNPQIDDVLREPPGITRFPDCVQVLMLDYSFDEFAPTVP